MKFQCSVIINKPKALVAELLNDPKNLGEWQDGFISYEHLTGDPGETGATALMKYDMKGRKLDLTETILENGMPDFFKAKYSCDPTENFLTLKISEIDANKTRIVEDIEYTRLSGILLKVMAFVLPNMFKNQAQKWLDQFKAFVERN